jgi:hypothetical protein
MSSTGEGDARLLAQVAWRRFLQGRTSEAEDDFIARMGKVGGSRGGSHAAIRAIADACNKHGVDMTAGRLMKILSTAKDDAFTRELMQRQVSAGATHAAGTDRERGFVMAVGAWHRFGHSDEPEEAFANRIADIAGTDGLSAAAEAIAQDCRARGLEMSAQRVLKSLAGDLQHGGQPGTTPIPPGVLELTRRANTPSSGLSPVVVLIAVAVVVGAIWYLLL